MSFIQGDPVAGIHALAHINQRIRMGSLACLTLLAYDTVTCLDDEVEHIWKARWTVPKILYICLRYCGLVFVLFDCAMQLIPSTNLSELACASYPAIEATGPFILGVQVHVIMIFRINALYGSNKILYPVIFVSLVVVVGALVISILVVRLAHLAPAPAFLSSIASCMFVGDLPRTGLLKWSLTMTLCLDCLYTALTLYKFVYSVRALRKAEFSTVLSIFVGDGIIYFLMSIAVNVVDMMISSGNKSLLPYAQVTQTWLSAFYSYAGSHLILHLRSKTASQNTTRSTGRDDFIRFRNNAQLRHAESTESGLRSTTQRLSSRSSSQAWAGRSPQVLYVP